MALREDDGITGPMAVVTICKSLLGGAIFSLSYALRQGTLLPGMLSLGFTGIVAAASFHMLGGASRQWGLSSFRGLWQRSVGSSLAMDWIIVVNGCLTLLSYAVMVADNTSSALVGLLGEGHPLALGREAAVLVVALGVLLPLCLAPTLTALRHASVLGMCAMCYTILLVLLDAALSPAAREQDPELAVPIARLTPGLFSAIAIFSQSFVAHYNAPTIYSELRDKRPSSWTRVVATAYALAFAAYLSFALAGARRFGSRVEGNVLRMYPATTATMLAWLSISVSTAMSYPLVFHPFRDSCVGLLCRWRGSAVEKAPPAEVRSQQVLVALAFVPLSALVGGRVDDLGVVNALTGAVTGCLVAYICPAIIYRTAVRERLRSSEPQGEARLRRSSAAAVAIGVTGVFFACVGTVVVLAGVE